MTLPEQIEQIEIPLSKKKLLVLFPCGIVFVGLGLFLMISSAYHVFVTPFFLAPYFFAIGLISVLFFGLCTAVIFLKLFDKKAGLIINGQGIVFSDGLVVPWSDVEKIRIYEFKGQKFLVPIVKNPQDYIDGATNLIKRKMAKMSFDICGSPVSIVASHLQINFDNLYDLLTEKMNDNQLVQASSDGVEIVQRANGG